jgi:hypothetical protein
MKSNIVIRTLLILAASWLFSSSTLKAQDVIVIDKGTINYRNAVGLRFGVTTGITYNHKFDRYNSLNFIFGAFPYSYGVTVLYERYVRTSEENLSFYYGLGGHISGAYYRTWYYYNTERNRYTYYRTYGPSPIVGIDFVAGLEFKFPGAPLALNFEIKPRAEFFNTFGPYFSLDPGLGIKFVF